ncbi:hypothetical protein EJ02DRAFT_431595, partial [Clathrospora elynae]
MLKDMPDAEYDKWIESLEKLVEGDGEMLLRSDPNISSHDLRMARATPAPVDVRRQAKMTEVDNSQTRIAVKQEHDANSSGSDNLNPEDGVKLAQTIMDNLQSRVSADCIGLKGLGGVNKSYTKFELQTAIVNAFLKPGRPFHFLSVKKDVKASLIPWIIAEAGAFHELKAMSFVFAHTMPFASVILNAFFGSWSAASRMSGSQRNPWALPTFSTSPGLSPPRRVPGAEGLACYHDLGADERT